MATYGIGTLLALELQRRGTTQCSSFGGGNWNVGSGNGSGNGNRNGIGNGDGNGNGNGNGSGIGSGNGNGIGSGNGNGSGNGSGNGNGSGIGNSDGNGNGNGSPAETLNTTAQTTTGKPDTPPKASTPPNPSATTTTPSTTHTARGGEVGAFTAPSRSSTSNSATLATESLPKPSSVPISGNSSPSNGNTRVIAGSVVAVVAAILILLGFHCWRQRRKTYHAEETYKRDEDDTRVSPYTLANPNPGFVPRKRSGGVSVSYVAPQQTEDRGTSTPEHQGSEQPSMNVYLRLDTMSRDLADLRRMMHNSRGVGGSLPEYSS
ncbi:hypothetical protein PM082_009691 [Marasmius tenuissimus]|nr:hypothetical protein PM082_009691 [Marasmius tenuissimus]